MDFHLIHVIVSYLTPVLSFESSKGKNPGNKEKSIYPYVKDLKIFRLLFSCVGAQKNLHKKQLHLFICQFGCYLFEQRFSAEEFEKRKGLLTHSRNLLDFIFDVRERDCESNIQDFIMYLLPIFRKPAQLWALQELQTFKFESRVKHLMDKNEYEEVLELIQVKKIARKNKRKDIA